MTFDVRSSAPGEYGNLRLVSALLEFDSAGGAVELEDLAAGDVIISAWAEVLEAYNAGTTNVVTLGDGTTGDKFLAAGDVTEGSLGVTPAGGKGPFAAEAAAGTLTATYAQSGTAATAGSARIYALVSSAPR